MFNKSFSPKFSFYYSDGSGRDDYITVNNGGFIKKNKLTKSFKPFNAQIKTHYNDLFLMRPLNHYTLDGTGRDFYIYRGNAVNHLYESNLVDFKKLLRSESCDFKPYSTKNKFKFKLSEREKEMRKKYKIFENSLLERIYYKFTFSQNNNSRNLNKIKSNSLKMNSNDSKNILKKSSSVVQFNPICKNNKLPLNIKLVKKKYNHLNQANENNYNFKNNLRKLYEWNCYS